MKLSDALFATAELCGTKLSEMAAEMLLMDLSACPEPEVHLALAKCRRELKGRLTVAEIISRIDDGRPGADEAWGHLAWEEELTAVITAEMEEAQGAAWSLWRHGDKVGARLAFKDAYTRLITQARTERRPVDWRISVGWDKAGRVGPLAEAVQKKRIAADVANRFLGDDRLADSGKLLPAAPMPDSVRRMISGVVDKDADD